MSNYTTADTMPHYTIPVRRQTLVHVLNDGWGVQLKGGFDGNRLGNDASLKL